MIVAYHLCIIRMKKLFLPGLFLHLFLKFVHLFVILSIPRIPLPTDWEKRHCTRYLQTISKLILKCSIQFSRLCFKNITLRFFTNPETRLQLHDFQINSILKHGHMNITE